MFSKSVIKEKERTFCSTLIARWPERKKKLGTSVEKKEDIAYPNGRISE